MHSPSQYMLRWEINTECNLRCIHCCNAESSIKRGDNHLSLATIKNTIEYLSNEGLKRIHFLGGEPLMRRDFIEICSFCTSRKLSLSFNTNGILLKKDLFHRVIEIPFVSITISLDGPDPESHDAIRGAGTFNIVVDAIKHLVKERNNNRLSYPSIIIQSTLTLLWNHKIDKLFNLVESIGADGIVINNLALEGRAKQHKIVLSLSDEEEFQAAGKIFSNIYKHSNLFVKTPFKSKVALYYRKIFGIDIAGIPFSCRGGLDTAYVFSDGRVSPCMVAEIQGMGASFAITKIQDLDSESFWNSDYFSYFRSIVHASPQETYRNLSPCNECNFLGNLCKPCPLTLSSAIKPIVTPCKLAQEHFNLNS